MNYFFYKGFVFCKRIKHEAPLLVAAIMVSIIEFANLYIILLVIDTYFFNIKSVITDIFTCVMFIGIVLMFLNVRYYSKNVEQICEKYKEEKILKNILGYIFYVGYYIGSIILVIWLK